jgi:hypothetical protein
MAIRQNTFLLKRSNVPNKIPQLTGLTLGEMALNVSDAKLYSLFTSGTTGATEVREIGWNRIHRTGDTVTGDFNFFGDISISGSSLPNGYALSVTGDTNQIGNFTITGNTTQIGNITLSGNSFITGNTTQIGNYHITGNTSQEGIYTHSGDTFITGNTTQIGNYNTTGNTTQYGNTYISGTSLSGQCAFEVDGNVCIDGDVRISGNTTQTGSTSQIGNVLLTGNTNQLGYLYIVSATTGCTFAVTGNTCLDGDLDISGNTFMSGDFCMNNMNSAGETGTNCLDTSLIPTGTTVTHQFQGSSGVLAHVGDLSSGEPNSRGYTYFENNIGNTTFTATSVPALVIGPPQTFTPYNNFFSATTGNTVATTNKLTYTYSAATGTTYTYLKYTVSLSVKNGNSQILTFNLRQKRGLTTTFLPIGMSIDPSGAGSYPISFNGIAQALFGDEFEVFVTNTKNPPSSVLITDFSFSMFT